MRTSKIKDISDDDFRRIVSESYSFAEVTKKCGYRTFKSGGGRQSVIRRIKCLELDTSHFRATGRQFETPPHNKISDYDTILVKKSNANRMTVKDVVVREQLVEYKCSICKNNGTWNNKPLSLQLHHKDGDATNNEIDNLEFLCPNCHSQTDNYGYKNATRQPPKRYYCTVCGAEITKTSRTGKCRLCSAKHRSINVPEREDLIEVVKEVKFKKYICYHYGVCEHTFEQWLKLYDLPVYISELHKYIAEQANQ